MEETMPGNELSCLERISALLERASSLSNMERLRNGPFPAIQDVSLFHACAQDLSEEIARIDAGAQRARILRDADRQLEIIRSTVAPIRRLPSELLSEVFKVVVCSQPPYERTFAARILAAVCAIWRETALGTANFWTCVDLSRATRKTVEALLEMHADLVKGLPLRVCQRPGVDVNEQMRCMLALPSNYTDLVEEISFRGDEVALSLRRAPELSSLIRADLSIYGQNASRALLFLRRAHDLRSLSVRLEHNCTIYSDLSIPIFPYLTELQLIDNRHGLFTNIIPPVLKGCAMSLQRLVMSTHEEIRWKGGNVIMPALRSVDLQYNAHHLLSHMDAHGLEDVILREAHNPFVSLRHVVSTPPIRTLGLVYVDASDDSNTRQFDDCLRRLEALTDYSVADLDDDHPVIHPDLARTTYFESQQPALTSLHLRHNGKVYYAPVELDAYSRDTQPAPNPQPAPIPQSSPTTVSRLQELFRLVHQMEEEGRSFLSQATQAAS